MNEIEEHNGLYKTEGGLVFPGFSANIVEDTYKTLFSEYEISPIQITEAASYSFAMVARFALGLSATGGAVGAIIGDDLYGYTAVNTIRHLSNAGAVPSIFIVAQQNCITEELKFYLAPLLKTGVEITFIENEENISSLVAALSECHNALFGFRTPPDNSIASLMIQIVAQINEIQTPIHVVNTPYNVDLDSGVGLTEPLFASSTLSLGLPYLGLSPGNQYVGRHYLCDISIPPMLYQQAGFDLSPLFAEQPVIKILPEVS